MKNQIKLKNQTGITLVALVITIIVLLILAGVAINLTVGDNGIFKRAEESTQIYQNAANNEAKELNTAVGEMDKLILGMTLDIQYTSTDNSITVQVNGVKATGYIFSIKKVDEENYTAMPEQTESTYTFTELEGATYKIKIEIKTDTVTLEREIEATTKMPDAEGIIQFSDVKWVNGKASVTINNTRQEYIVQYQVKNDAEVEGEEWEEGAEGAEVIEVSNLNLDDTVYARLWNGEKGGNSASITIKDIVKPNEAKITSTSVDKSITATVQQSDSQSGVDIGECRWVCNKTSTAIGTDAESYTGGTFSSTSQNLSLNVTTAGTYYLHVLTVDNAGNAIETISEPITIVQLVTGISLNKTSTTLAIGGTEKLVATVSPDDATNKTVEWSSSDTAIATVNSEGTITGNAGGTAVITAKATDGSGKSASCTVTVGYIISTPQDLQNMGNDLAGHYYVVNDIDMSGFNFTKIKGGFTGTLDGQGYTISNLTITSTSANIAMFELLEGGAEIKNLLLKDVGISSSRQFISVIAVDARGEVSFSKVGITGKVTGDGYVVGFVSNAVYQYGVECRLSFQDCYARVDLVGDTWGGAGFAIVGGDKNEGMFTVNNSYWSGTNDFTKVTGSLIAVRGDSDNTATSDCISVNNCYYDKELFPLSITTAHSGTGLTTANMKKQSSYVGWDFENTWYMGEDGYPELKFD